MQASHARETEIIKRKRDDDLNARLKSRKLRNQ